MQAGNALARMPDRLALALQKKQPAVVFPSMNAALIPVRSVPGAKNRLASTLDLEHRRRLALAMLADMVAALAKASSLGRIVVVSADAGLLDQARTLGAETIDEGRPRGLNTAVWMAAEQLQASGVRRLLTIPGDVPLLEAAEVDALFAVDAPVLLVPSASGSGTNGLLTSPPTVVQPQFEGESLAAHLNVCRAAGIEARVLPLSGFALDVDTPEDLDLLARQGDGRHSARIAIEAQDWRAHTPGATL